MRFRLHDFWIATSHDGGESWQLTEGPLENALHASAVGNGLDCLWIAVRVTSLEGLGRK